MRTKLGDLTRPWNIQMGPNQPETTIIFYTEIVVKKCARTYE